MRNKTKKPIFLRFQTGLFTSVKTTLSLIFLLALLESLTSCRLPSNSMPSTIVIAVDQLGVNQASCGEEDEDPTTAAGSGIALLCQESIRFTHAYTTSLQSGPALTSVLTGQYPFQHGLRGNAKAFLSAKAVTLAEVAQRQQVATSFFSGGAPILRKLNLQQGFEIFDDHFAPSMNHLHRPFAKLQKIFETWLQEVRGRSFLSFLYVPDLDLTWTPTQTDRGESRNLSYDSQVEEFDETLWHFLQSLKQRHLWDSTNIILVGLNGPAVNGHGDELFNTNLYSERTQVGLLIKPAKFLRPEISNWSFDENINLADLGKTLLDLYGVDSKPDENWPLVSLVSNLKSSSAQIGVERPMPIESSWSEMPISRTSIRWGPYLFLLDESPRAFNSLTDKEETTSLHFSDSNVQDKWQQIQKLQSQYQIASWKPLSPELHIKWKSLTDIWSLPPPLSQEKSTSFERLAHRLHDDPEISLQYARELMRTQTWEDLERWAQGLKMQDLEKVADKNMKKDNRRPFHEPCLAVLETQKPQTSDLKKCTDALALPLLEWILADRDENADFAMRESLRRKFLRLYVLNSIDQDITEANWALQAPWDLSMLLRQPPLTMEMMLSLPEMQKYKQQAQKAVQQSQTDVLEL